MNERQIINLDPSEYKLISDKPVNSGNRFPESMGSLLNPPTFLQKLAGGTRRITETMQYGLKSFGASIVNCDMPVTAALITATASVCAAGLVGWGVGYYIDNPDVITYGKWVAGGGAIIGWMSILTMALAEGDPDSK